MPRPLRPWLAAVILAAVFAIRAAGPVAWEPGSHTFGNWHHPDCLGNHWLLVWVAERLGAGESILLNDRYYFPFGDAPWLAGNGSEGFLYAPLHWIWGWPTAVGLYGLLVLWWNGFAGYLLGRAGGAGPWGSLVVLASTGLSVYVMQELNAGRFSQADIGFWLAALAAYLRLLDCPTRGGAVLTGTLVAAASALYWYHGVFFALAAAVLTLTRLPLVPWRHVALAAGISAAWVGPLLAVFLANWAQVPGTEDLAWPRDMPQLDAAALVWPLAVREGEHRGQATALVGLLLALVAIVRWVRGRSDHPRLDAGLVAVALLGWLLALGTATPLYEGLYGLHATLRRFWWPYRHVLIFQAAIALLAARGLRSLPGPRPVLALTAVGLVPLCLLLQRDPIHLHYTRVAPSTFHQALAEQPGEVLLGLPFSPQVSNSQLPLIYQLWHGKKMINGHAPWVRRVRPEAWDQRLRDNSFLTALAAYEQGENTTGTLRFKAQDLQALRAEGLSLVWLDRELFPVKLADAWSGLQVVLTGLFGQPVIVDGDRAAWEVSTWTGLTEVPAPIWVWPDRLHHGGRDTPLMSRLPTNSFLQAAMVADRGPPPEAKEAAGPGSSAD